MDDDSRSQAILIVTAVFLAISGISVALRCFVRTHVVRAFGWDDTFMVLAMIFNLGFAICGIAGSKYGIGRRLIHFLEYPDNFRTAMLYWWLGQIFYVITCVLAKLSIIITLLRITVDRVHAWVLYAAMTLATTVGLVFFFFTIFQCHPVNFFWNQANPHKNGSCVNKSVLIGIAYMYSIGAAITDLTIGLLPVALIWNLRMNERTKMAIVGILGIGCIASAAVIIRIPFVHHYKDREFLYNTFQISIWSNVEAGLGITAGCLTTLRPLIRFLRDSSSASRSRNANAGSFPLSNNMAPGFHRSSRSKQKHERDDHPLWTASENDEYHGLTTTVMGSHLPNMTTGSEENLNPSRDGWKVERSVRVSIRDS